MMKSVVVFFDRIYEEIQKIEANEFHYQEQVQLNFTVLSGYERIAVSHQKEKYSWLF